MLNRVVLVGRLTKDPDLRYTQSGVAVANFTVACNRPFANQQGVREADFITCVVWRRAAENLRSEAHTSELQSRFDLVCRLLLEKQNIPVLRCPANRPPSRTSG